MGHFWRSGANGVARWDIREKSRRMWAGGWPCCYPGFEKQIPGSGAAVARDGWTDKAGGVEKAKESSPASFASRVKGGGSGQRSLQLSATQLLFEFLKPLIDACAFPHCADDAYSEN
jgi:hypothetical protein